MKLSEMTNGEPLRDEFESLPYPRSDLADPPITLEEAQASETANCRRHHGLMFSSRVSGDIHGRVYFCGAGREYWRYDKRQDGMYAPLRFPKAGP